LCGFVGDVTGAPTPTQIRDAVFDLLRDPGYRVRAKKIVEVAPNWVFARTNPPATVRVHATGAGGQSGASPVSENRRSLEDRALLLLDDKTTARMRCKGASDGHHESGGDSRSGGRGVLKIESLPIPTAKSGEVLIREGIRAQPVRSRLAKHFSSTKSLRRVAA
jgi:hypothetical protein